ncbi:MAG: PrsW family glutamic-type intramembrane protease [Firmicutes bacterium]|jgi:RsiW-degrading membrane proteinase PrsW (M82 family)|nr:PrsW family glutamic-type intramembrane protease [Bacillota bacterium]MDH7496101.1 PrsW family glutamic-type intramembrane protease [Bacillota bacterium]
MDPAAPGLVVLATVSLVPGIVWVWFFYRKDRAEPEPKTLVIRSFAFGVVSVFPAALLEAPFRRVIATGRKDLLALLVVSIFVVGVVEEVSKFVAVKLAAYDNPEFDEVMDGVVYAVAAGLGFAATENLFYASAYGLAVGVVRAFITDLAHASFSGIVGYYLGRAKADAPHATALVARGLGIAIALHGAYDFLIIGGIVPPGFGIFMVLGTYAYLSRKIAQAERLSPFATRPPVAGERPLGSTPLRSKKHAWTHAPAAMETAADALTRVPHSRDGVQPDSPQVEAHAEGAGRAFEEE